MTVQYDLFLARLSKLVDPILEEILFYAQVDRSTISPRVAPLSVRILDVARLADVNQDLCRRISASLDQHAPWTR